MRNTFLKLSLLGSLLLSSTSTFAGGTIAGSLAFTIPAAANAPTAVPSLSGSMLIVLSLLLFIVAFRIAKQKNARAGKFFITILGVGALSSGVGGINLVSTVDAGAVAQQTITLGLTPGSNTMGEVQLFDTTGPDGTSGFFVNYFDNPFPVPATIGIINTPGFTCSDTQIMMVRPIEPMAPTCRQGNIIQPAGNGASSQCQISCMPDSYFNGS